MQRVPIYLILIALFLPGEFLHGSPQDEIRKRQSELETLRDQIKQFEDKIQRQQKSEQATLELLDSYDRKGALLRRLITKLRNEEKRIEDSVKITRAQVNRLEAQLNFLKKQYANYVTSAYKAGKLHDIELLLASRSINQLYVRAEYLRYFSAQRRSDIAKILEKKGEIEDKQAELQEQLSEGRRLIAEKGAEEDHLAALTADRRQVLQKIRKDKKSAQRELDRRMQSAKELERLISDLIERERIKAERRAAEQQRLGRLPQPPPITGNFEGKKGKLRWPVSAGQIVARFGNQRHPTLKTITQNTGIDIAVKSGTEVSSVADGEVSIIAFLPAYGNIVIVDHYDGYRTVYSHLAEIRVTQGQRVKEGDSIGTSGESLEGPRLHFELWKDREKQNPELWLSPQ